MGHGGFILTPTNMPLKPSLCWDKPVCPTGTAITTHEQVCILKSFTRAAKPGRNHQALKPPAWPSSPFTHLTGVWWQPAEQGRMDGDRQAARRVQLSDKPQLCPSYASITRSSAGDTADRGLDATLPAQGLFPGSGLLARGLAWGADKWAAGIQLGGHPEEEPRRGS